MGWQSRLAGSVVLIVIDCLRADHLSCYGYHRSTTPTIDAMARCGTVWENAYAASSWTKPSVTSMFTGVYPSQHGVFRGIKRSRGGAEVTTDVLPSTQTTLAERFARAGWRCGAFINNAQLGEYTGLNRGFDAYVPNAGKADRLLALFTDWLDADPDRPFFAYLHLLEAHWPYKPRRRHMAMFGGDRDTNFFKDHSARDFGRLRRSIRRKEAELSDDQLVQMIQMYDGAIRRLDGKVKLVLAELRQRGIEDETAVFVTADHGEEFLDHQQIGHGQSLYEELIHVPLVGVIPEAAGGGLPARRARPVSQVDLGDMLLRITGAEPGGMPEVFATGSTEAAPVFAELSTGKKYVQTIRVGSVNRQSLLAGQAKPACRSACRAWKLHRRYKFTKHYDPALTPREQVAGKLVGRRDPHETHLELYNLSADPAEQVNLAHDEAHAAVRDDLVAQLDEWWQRVATADGEEAELDPRIVERLRDLGYIE